MEKLVYEIPSIRRKYDAIDYVNEFYAHNSNVSGSGGLDMYVHNYDEWLIKLEKDLKQIPNEERVPSKTFFSSQSKR